MKAIAQIKNTQNKLVGYWIDERFITREEASENCDVIENLVLDANGQIEFVGDVLPVWTLREVNQRNYQKLVKKNGLSREIQTQLEVWKKEKNDYVLYLLGARQIGKTTEIQKFVYQHYENILYLDLSIDQLRNSLEQCMQRTTNIAFAIANFCRQNRRMAFEDNEDMVLVLDEIQESVVIYNMIRQMQKELRCHMIVTGSYLGKTINSHYFKPAGNVWYVELLPLSFAEFCAAFGCRELLFQINCTGCIRQNM